MSDDLKKRIEELEEETAELSAQLIALAEYSHEQTVSTRALIGIMIAILAPEDEETFFLEHKAKMRNPEFLKGIEMFQEELLAKLKDRAGKIQRERIDQIKAIFQA